MLGVTTKPKTVSVNGKPVKSFRYDTGLKALVLILPDGEGMLGF